MSIHRYQLSSNGLNIFVDPMQSNPAVTVIVGFKAGSLYENEKNNGIAHFTEHLFFRGGKRYPTARDVATAIRGLGGYTNAFTYSEKVIYIIRIPALHIEKGLDIISDMLLNARFDEPDIEEERGPVLQEINMNYDDISDASHKAVKTLMVDKSSPHFWDIIGTPKNILSFQQADFLNFRNAHYVADNGLVAVAGGVKPRQVFKLAEKYFSEFKSTVPNMPKRAPFQAFDGTERVAYFPMDREQVRIVLTVPTVFMNDPKEKTAMILNSIFGGGMSSRLFEEVRSKKSLAYSVGSYISNGQDFGWLNCVALTSPDKVVDTTEAIMEVCGSMVVNPPSITECLNARNYFTGSLDIGAGTQSIEYISAYRMVNQELLRGRARSIGELIKEYNSVTSQDVTQMAYEVFVPNNFKLALAGPVSDEMLEDIKRRVSIFSGAGVLEASFK